MAALGIYSVIPYPYVNDGKDSSKNLFPILPHQACTSSSHGEIFYPVNPHIMLHAPYIMFQVV